MKTALLIVDVQNDFCEGGSLAVDGGAAVAAGVTRHLAERRQDYDFVVASADWHVDPGSHFASSADRPPDFVDTWPDHCVAESHGAQFHPDLDTNGVDTVVRKGRKQAAYSAFEGTNAEGESLAQLLRDRGIDAVDVVGIATDYCVRATVLDAAKAGFTTRVLTHLVAGVAADTSAAALDEMAAAGVVVE